MSSFRSQQTVKKPVTVTGIGVHSGKTVTLTVRPADVNHGIKFRRIDLPDQPVISANFHRVVDTSLATVIGESGAIVSTVEHLMAVFAGMGVDNALVDVDNYELPIMDGSAQPFAQMIGKAGIASQPGPRFFFSIKNPITLSENGKSVELLPDDECFRITCHIDFDHPLVGRQEISLEITRESFEKEIAAARTFGFLHDIEYLSRYGFSRGGSLDNVIVIDKDRIVNTGGLRFKDEFVRHKILDAIGDFSLLGLPIKGHAILKKSGHAFNHAFIKTFFERKSDWETIAA